MIVPISTASQGVSGTPPPQHPLNTPLSSLEECRPIAFADFAVFQKFLENYKAKQNAAEKMKFVENRCLKTRDACVRYTDILIY